MIEISTIPDDSLALSMRMMKEEIIKRGWTALCPYEGSPHFFIDRGDGRRIHVFSTTPPSTTFAAAQLANNKFATYEVLRSAGMPQLESMIVREDTPEDDLEEFMHKMGTIVVKPVDGAHGKGITVNVNTSERLISALKDARDEQKSVQASLLQKQYPHSTNYDIRISVIDYKFIAATLRVAARVHGDGEHTIRELLEIENSSERRGKPYFASLASIDLTKAASYLDDQIDSIPAEHEEVSVLGIANYGAGGETYDVTDDIPKWLIELAEKAAEAVELPVTGVDFMLAERPTVESTFEDLDPTITELNKCPLLAMHDAPTNGQPRGAVHAYVEYLATLNHGD